MKKYSGIDLHSNNSVIVVTDETDKVRYQRRLANDLGQILAALAPHREELVGVVVESTFNWHWLVDGLIEAGYRVHLANTNAIKKYYEGLKYSTDETDAAHFAQLLRLKLLPTGNIYPRAAAPGAGCDGSESPGVSSQHQEAWSGALAGGGGGYFRLFPYAVTRAAPASITRSERAAIYFLSASMGNRPQPAPDPCGPAVAFPPLHGHAG